MPPNVSNSSTSTVNNEQQVQNCKQQANEKESNGNKGKIDTNDAKDKTKSIISKIINFLFYLSVFLLVFVALFIFVPWEDYLFDEGEIENYIDMYTNQEEGDWQVHEFLATAEQNLTEPVYVCFFINFYWCFLIYR